DAAISDITAKGIEIGGEEGSEPQTLVFEDQERARVALKGFIETILPREYVREKVAESLDGIVPYATGQADSFTVDFETGERIEAFPDALRFAAAEIELGELISQQVIAPLVADIGDSFTDQAFGVSFSGDEAQ